MKKLGKEELQSQINYRLVEALRESEERYRSLVDNLHEVLFSIDDVGCINYLNPAWYSCMGFTVEESLGKPMTGFVHHEDKAQFKDLLLVRGLSPMVKLRFLTKDEQIRLMEFYVSEHNPNEQGWGFTGLLVDVTEKERLLNEFRESKDRYELVVRASNDGVWDWDIKTNKVYFSDRWKSMLGFTSEEIGNSLSEWTSRVHPQDLPLAYKELDRYFEGVADHYECLMRMRHKDGSWRWILDRGMTFKNEDGLPLRMAGSHTDLTHLKSVEEKLKAREQELKAIIDICPDGIVSLGSDKKIHFVNPAFFQITGMVLSDVIELSLLGFWEKILHLFSVDGDIGLSELMVVEGKELTLRSKMSAKVIKLSVRFHDGESIRQMLYLRDITIESEVDRMKSEFLSTAAHELRTPMASVYGFSELLLLNDYDKDTYIDIVRTIHGQSKALTQMINELLDLARIEARLGKDFLMKIQPVDAIVKQVIKEVSVAETARNISVCSAKKIPDLLIDRDKMKQVFLNLLGNAIKYSDANSSINIRILCEEKQDRQFVGIEIRDQGIGMSADQQSHMFERFWRADTSGKVPGTGLGLSLVKEIVEIHHGYVDVESQYQKGTTVTVWLPVPSENPKSEPGASTS